MSFRIMQGDLEPDLQLRLTVKGEVTDLSDASALEMLWIKPDGSEATVSLTIVDLSVGLVKRVWESGDTDLPGIHRARARITRGNGEYQTFPSNGTYFRWQVTE